jgi:CRISPR-associated protein (TIGR03984 family)
LFGEAGELLLWRADDGWLARLIQEHPSEGDPFDEYQLLWGTRETFFPDVTFTLLREGAQGFHHAVPIEVGLNQRVRLRVRHFIEYNPDGEARIALSRLVAFELA